MSKKLLNDLAGILAELEVSYDEAVRVAIEIDRLFDNTQEIDEFIDIASNAPSAGECGC
jgi:hypothetical protein